ncbi:hypothetical protein [Bradyrhizobium sp. 144]|uniref:hypothetical protein n=1 Tax=Bradyrhizobium sp. 144 TaxID=2782620 RepID=UPI001FFB3211|nr:hypothetical protein [Bradyrhizobium sp. 144]MCK1695344.1 hypothetical protein [Bradyrhizobium sp. 144]
MAKTPVFVSFDFDNDKVLKDFIIGRSKHGDSPFSVIDHSLKAAARELRRRKIGRKRRAALSNARMSSVPVNNAGLPRETTHSFALLGEG